MLKIKRNNIIHHLHERDMSISELSKKAGVNEKTIYNIINKKNTPKVSLAKTIANIFGSNIDGVFEFEEE